MRSRGGRALAVEAVLRWAGNPGTAAAVLAPVFTALVAVPGAVAAVVATSTADFGQALWSERGRPVLSSGADQWTSGPAGTRA
ncbi:hypothetical protein [Streptomyces sp. TLI_171]|uniref:hypothetical protein n=1 Tax=Streptomyces sp. TLI_171 TaxID=1938859 RepID=UPI000C195091|nr:hypothetical protein [Streptomyces sp. TLI_171]RKE23546.1 hypothetical protein BX266_7020 [Streptomyces sp. TLI_171]